MDNKKYHHHFKRILRQGWAWTDYPMTEQEQRNSAEKRIKAPLRRVKVHSYDGNKYVKCSWDQPLSDGTFFTHYEDVKSGYLFACKRDYRKCNNYRRDWLNVEWTPVELMLKEYAEKSIRKAFGEVHEKIVERIVKKLLDYDAKKTPPPRGE